MRALFPTCSILTPVTGDPYPATGPAHPVAFHPYTPRIWARNPAAGDPFIACSGPTPQVKVVHNWRCGPVKGWRAAQLSSGGGRRDGLHAVLRVGPDRASLRLPTQQASRPNDQRRVLY